MRISLPVSNGPSRPRRVLRALVLGAVAALGAVMPVQACDVLAPQNVRYKVERGDMTLGKGRITLEADPQAPGCYIFRQTARPSFMLRLLTGPIEEESRFCLNGDQFNSQRYFYHRDGLGAEKENFRLAFDWDTRSVSGGEFGTLELPDGAASDQLLMQLRVRRWICETVARTGHEPEDSIWVDFVKRRGLDRYELGITGREDIQVPAGRFETVKVERLDPSSRHTTFWLAPNLAYLVVKAEQRKDDDPPFRLSLLELPEARK